jgi:ribose 5-phosphate isomerase B
MNIAIGSDHSGITLKKFIIDNIKSETISFTDFGPNTTESVDYPDYISKTVRSIIENKADKAIVICGTGIGANITANKINGIRSALCFNSYMAEKASAHNDSNVLALGARVLGDELALDIIKTWLNTEFEGGRHQRRIDKISQIEKDESSS